MILPTWDNLRRSQAAPWPFASLPILSEQQAMQVVGLGGAAECSHIQQPRVHERLLMPPSCNCQLLLEPNGPTTAAASKDWKNTEAQALVRRSLHGWDTVKFQSYCARVQLQLCPDVFLG